MSEQRLDTLPVSVEVVDQAVDDVLGMVARRLGVEVTRSGTLYYIGTLRQEDRGVLVRRARRLGQGDLNAVCSTLLSEGGRLHALADGLLVVADRVEVLQRVHELVDRIEASESATWVCQLYLVSLSDDERATLGLDARSAAEMSATFAAASSGLPAAPGTGLALNASLAAVLDAGRRSGDHAIQAEPLFLLLDGGQAEFVRGDRIPVPRRTVSDQGTVTTSAFETVQTGLQVQCSLREQSPTSARCTVEVSISEVTGFVEEAPIVKAEDFRAEAEIQSGGVYLVGSLRRTDRRSGREWGFRLSRDDQVRQEVLEVWLRAYRIGCPIGETSITRPAAGGAQPAGGPTLEVSP